MDSKTYLQWIMGHNGTDYTLKQVEEDKVTIESDCVDGIVTVYHLESDIVELQLCRKRDGENVFFLHFELVDEEHAKSLFEEMLDTLRKQKEKNTVQVLLCCTSGMTTSFFAQKLNEANDTLSSGLHFDAVPYALLYEKGAEYDVILAAPQIGYELKNIVAAFSKKLVLAMPTQIFASYDAGAMISIVLKERQKMLETKEEKAVAKVMREIENTACIFVINMTHDRDETRYAYRLYNKGEIIETRQIIKQNNSTRDIMDILDTDFFLLRKNWRIDAVSISIPGILIHGDAEVRIDYEEFARMLKEKYDIPVYVQHNTLAVAYGYYAQQDKYDIISYHSMPRGALIGGQGTVYRGMPLGGHNNMAGELQPIFYRENPGVELGKEKDFTKEDVRRMLVSYILANISIVSPQVFLIRCQALPDMNELHDELRKYLDEKYIPKLIYVDDVNEYSLLGAMLYGLHRLQRDAKKKLKKH